MQTQTQDLLARRNQFFRSIVENRLSKILDFTVTTKTSITEQNYDKINATLTFARHRGVLPSVKFCCEALAQLNEVYAQGENRLDSNSFANKTAYALIDCVVDQVQDGKTFERIYAQILRTQAQRFGQSDFTQARVQEEWMNYAQNATYAKVLDNHKRHSDMSVTFKKVPAVLPPRIVWNGRSL